MDNRFEFNTRNFIRASLELVTGKPLDEIDKGINKLTGWLPRRRPVVPPQEVIVPVQPKEVISLKEYLAKKSQ